MFILLIFEWWKGKRGGKEGGGKGEIEIFEVGRVLIFFFLKIDLMGMTPINGSDM